ncbi:MAG TPA: glycosyltransferase family 4 protein [Thermodesulfobacteriota bacterium]|nr:glycosyltransferase family 4 protein [Thermodesulfobacteriota bacterium]
MKVLFLIQGFSVAASRYRVLQYIPYLESKGVQAEVSLYPRTLKENFRFFNQLSQYDIVFLQRKRFSQPRLALLRKKAKRIVYDFDDSVMYRNSKAKDPLSSTRRRRFVQMIKNSDFVIAGNEFLKSQVLPLNQNVEVIPTAIIAERYQLKTYPAQAGRVILGWIGDHGSIHYLEKMRHVFERLGERYPHVELKIVCDTFFDCDRMEVIKKNWSPEEEVADLQGFDIGLMPLVDDPWSWGKCGLKIIQYQGVGVPVVCTPVGINKDLVEDGVNGFYAMTPEEWERKLSLLIENSELREQMGREGRKRVLRKYASKVCAPRLFSILTRMMEKPSEGRRSH